MKHLGKIQAEFLKEAAKWEELSRETQQQYLKQHPKSKRRLTAKPEKDVGDVKAELGKKKEVLSKKDREEQELTKHQTEFWDAFNMKSKSGKYTAPSSVEDFEDAEDILDEETIDKIGEAPTISLKDMKKKNPEFFNFTRELDKQYKSEDEEPPEEPVDEFRETDDYLVWTVGDDAEPFNPATQDFVFDKKTGKMVGLIGM